ncbi:hypothetical protein ACFX2K_028049 [Malus domestica]
MPNLTVMLSQFVEGSKVQGNTTYGVCSIQGHLSEKCPQLIENGGWESANAIGFQGQHQPKYNPYANIYNPGWRDHPNMKWREPQQPQQQRGFLQPPPRMFQRPFAPMQPQPQSAQLNSGSSMDSDTILKLLTSLTQSVHNQAKEVGELKNQIDGEVREMKNQIGQIAVFMGQFRKQGKLPSSTTVNPKEIFETANAITLRSGKKVGTSPKMSKSS